jgi:DNA repair protein RadC
MGGLMKLFIKEKCSFNYYTTSPEQVFNEFKDLANTDQESLWILGLNTKNKVMCKEMVALGGLDTTVVYPRVIFKRLLMTDSSSVIMVHNHPSGIPEPSNDDIRLTTTVKDGGKIMDIKLLDHLIVGDGTYFSFREKNIL